MTENLTLQDILNDIEEISLQPIISPQEGEKYEYNNVLFGIKFTFEIVKEHKEYYDILINDTKPDVLEKNFEMVEMFNDGTITRLFED
jgi:hypothetical protein